MNKIIIGDEYVFKYMYIGENDADLEDYNGLPCIVKTMKSEDIEHNNLYEVEFDNGSEFNVYGKELFPCKNGLITA